MRIALGNARAVARHATIRGLICSATRDAGDEFARIELVGDLMGEELIPIAQ